MNNPEVENLYKELVNLESIEGLLGTAIVSRDGLLIFSHLPRDIDERKFGAMVATMFGALNTAASTLENENEKVHRLTVEYEEYQIIALDLNEKYIIISLIELNIDYGLVLLEIEEFIRRIKPIL